MKPLLAQARDVLDGHTEMPRGQSACVAALLARQALEQTVSTLCERAIQRLDNPVTMRSRLIVLRTLGDAAQARIAETAWIGLSNACHHHAYELTPTTSEVRHLLDLVTRLAEGRRSAQAVEPDDIEINELHAGGDPWT